MSILTCWVIACITFSVGFVVGAILGHQERDQ